MAAVPCCRSATTRSRSCRLRWARLQRSFVDNGGPLEVAGTVNIDDTRTYALDALVEPRAGAPESLVEGLKIMTAEPDAEGRRRLNLTGSL